MSLDTDRSYFTAGDVTWFDRFRCYIFIRIKTGNISLASNHACNQYWRSSTSELPLTTSEYTTLASRQTPISCPLSESTMPFNFSFSSSATFVTTSSVNGQSQGWAYRREAYSTNDGSGVRTTKQKLGEAPITQMRMYDAQGRSLLTEGNDSGSSSRPRQSKRGPSRRIISIEDVTEEEDKKAEESSRQ